MTRRRLAVALVALALVAGPVAAHGNYVSADPQVSTDGTVRIELAVVVTEGFLVLHTDDNGTPGEPVGHRAFDGNIQSDYAVEFDDAYWANRSGNVSVWIVLHRDDGDGEFDPADDPVQTTGSDGSIVADRFAVRTAGTGAFNVMAERDQAQETDRNAVTLRSVRLGTDGYVVIRADAEGAPGRIVGQQALPAGAHGPVDVTIDEQFYERRPEDFALWAVVHASDGDGSFNSSDDPAVRVGDSRVMTRFFVERTDPIEQTPTPDPTATPTITESTPTGSPTPTATPTPDHDDHEHTDASPTDATSTSGSHDDHEQTTSTPTPAGTTASPGQPGFTAAVAVVVVLGFGLLARRRVRR